MKDGDKIIITSHTTLYGMSLKGRTGRVKDIGEEWVTVEITGVEWLVRVPRAAASPRVPSTPDQSE